MLKICLFVQQNFRNNSIVQPSHLTPSRSPQIQLAARESFSVCVCSLEEFVNIGWPQFHSKMPNGEYITNIIKSLPFKLKYFANEKQLDHIPTIDEPVTPFRTKENFLIENILPSS